MLCRRTFSARRRSPSGTRAFSGSRARPSSPSFRLSLISTSEYSFSHQMTSSRYEVRSNKQSEINVLFELGLFIGQVGQNRCFIVVPEGAGDLRFPTDLLGVEPSNYETSRSDSNWQAATGPACTDICRELQTHGPRTVLEDRTEGTSPAKVAPDRVSKKPERNTIQLGKNRPSNPGYCPWLRGDPPMLSRRLRRLSQTSPCREKLLG